jgi:hypothetical protein
VSDDRYVARFGPTRRDLLLVPASLIFVGVGVAMARDGETVIGVLGALLGGSYLLLWAIVSLSRRVAFAVDERGITMGHNQPWKSGAAFAPWADVHGIVLWRQSAGRTSMLYVGVLRRPDAPPLPGSARSELLRDINAAFVPANLPRDLVADSRPVSFWQLDKERLAAALARFAPSVPLIDQT